MTIYIEYHGDGGQMCIPARAKKASISAAMDMVSRLSADKGHYCENHCGWFETDDELPCGYSLSRQEAIDTGWGLRWRGYTWKWG